MLRGRLRVGLLDLLSPPGCPGCDSPTVELGFCPACEPLLEPLPEAAADAIVVAAFAYGGPLAVAVQRLKYAGRTELAPVLGRLLATRAIAFAGSVDCVVPVPLHPSRLRARGFNQSALLSRPVAAALSVPLEVERLARVRVTPDQAGLPRAERAKNLRGAFVAHGPARADRVLLIDDVRTTGATLAQAADALLAGGCKRVHTLALARAPG